MARLVSSEATKFTHEWWTSFDRVGPVSRTGVPRELTELASCESAVVADGRVDIVLQYARGLPGWDDLHPPFNVIRT